jgi:hypothetical protein
LRSNGAVDIRCHSFIDSLLRKADLAKSTMTTHSYFALCQNGCASCRMGIRAQESATGGPSLPLVHLLPNSESIRKLLDGLLTLVGAAGRSVPFPTAAR